MESITRQDQHGETTISRRDALKAGLAGAGALGLAAVVGTVPGAATTEAAGKVVNIGAKDFSEPQIIARMYSLLLNQAGIPTQEHFGLSTAVAQPALIKGDLDVFPEYTGTGLEVVLKGTAPHTSSAYYKADVAGYKKWHLTWLAAAPMNDTQGLAVTQAVAHKYGLKTISDMVKHASQLRFIVNSEFLNRPDGLPGLKKAYGTFSFKSNKIVASPGLRYAALRSGLGDVVVAFTTDGAIAGDKLVVLVDDKGYAPPDNLAPVVRDVTLKAYPRLASILNGLAPKLTSTAVATMNYQVDVQHMDLGAVAKTFLKKQGLLK
ncbi:MAG: glycine betaine ABC transporter substrate-binding protein [Chloroflexota bacterium]